MVIVRLKNKAGAVVWTERFDDKVKATTWANDQKKQPAWKDGITVEIEDRTLAEKLAREAAAGDVAARQANRQDKLNSVRSKKGNIKNLNEAINLLDEIIELLT